MYPSGKGPAYSGPIRSGLFGGSTLFYIIIAWAAAGRDKEVNLPSGQAVRFGDLQYRLYKYTYISSRSFFFDSLSLSYLLL